jgi:hypothetical protein
LTALAVGDDVGMAERTRLVSKHLARRDKKSIQALASRLGEIRDVANWRRAVERSSQRAGLGFSGDLAVALGAIDPGHSANHFSIDSDGLDLAAWSVSADHLDLRQKRQPVGGGSR